MSSEQSKKQANSRQLPSDAGPHPDRLHNIISSKISMDGCFLATNNPGTTAVSAGLLVRVPATAQGRKHLQVPLSLRQFLLKARRYWTESASRLNCVCGFHIFYQWD